MVGLSSNVYPHSLSTAAEFMLLELRLCYPVDILHVSTIINAKIQPICYCQCVSFLSKGIKHICSGHIYRYLYQLIINPDSTKFDTIT